GQSIGAATPEEIESRRGTALKNAYGDWERLTHGIDQPTPEESRAMDDAWQRAIQTSDADPQSGERLADALIANPERGMTDDDSAAILKYKVDLLNAKNEAARRTFTGTPEERADAETA